MQVRRRVFHGLALASLCALLGSGLVAAKAGPISDELTAVRAAVARYHDYAQAVRDGYSLAGEPCVSSPAGTMGFHAVNLGLAASGANVPERPPILLYAPRAGRYELVAVEYWHIALANTPNGPAPWSGADAPPMGFFTPMQTIFGENFDGPMAGHNPQMPWHYDKHVWVVEANPAGVFQQFNPAITC
jgi:hypothetical protein